MLTQALLQCAGHLRALARKKQLQAMRRVEHLRAQAHAKRVQVMRRVGHLHRHVQSEGVEEAKCAPGAASTTAHINWQAQCSLKGS